MITQRKNSALVERFAAEIRAQRARLNLTQEDVARRSGLSAAHISHFECARRLPRLENAVSLAEALETTVSDLLGDG